MAQHLLPFHSNKSKIPKTTQFWVLFNFQILPLKDPPQSITIKLSDLILELTLKKVRSIIAIMHKSSSNGQKSGFFWHCVKLCVHREELHIQVVGWVNGDGKSGLRWFDGVSVGPFDRIVSLHYDVLELRDVMSCLPPNDFQTRTKAYYTVPDKRTTLEIPISFNFKSWMLENCTCMFLRY